MPRTLMDADLLTSEINDLEHEIIPETAALAMEMRASYERVIKYFEPTYNAGQDTTTLTLEEVRDILVTLAKFNQNLYRYALAYEFNLEVYKALKRDRRWYVGSRLKFLK